MASLRSLLLLPALLCAVSSLEASPVRQSLDEGWQFCNHRAKCWYPATVPGTVQTDLMALGMLEDPYFGMNEKKVQWVDKEDWDYRTVFAVSDDLLARERIRLDFLGVDTYAEIRLNGEKILETDNMHLRWSAEVKPLLRKAGNVLEVRFRSPVKQALPLYDSSRYVYHAWNDQAQNGGIFNKKISPWVRKSGYQFGWDWGPRVVTMGLWRPVVLEGWDTFRIEDVHYRTTAVSAASAHVEVEVEVEATREGPATVEVFADGLRSDGQALPDGPLARLETMLHAGTNKLTLPLDVLKPRLWWCNGMGEPYRYTFRTRVRNGDVRDVRKEKLGLRTIGLEQTPDSQGRGFRFVLNGQPFFSKGTNYIPNDLFLPRVTDSLRRSIIAAAVEANMNMMRIWGGGLYEEDSFYEQCDSLGLMLWQDLMFSCAVYPYAGAFAESCRKEVEYNVRRLRNHACIAIWGGNNECGDTYRHGERMGVYTPGGEVWQQYVRQYTELGDICTALCPEVPYLPTSPYPGDLSKPNSPTEGDMHYYSVWTGSKGMYYYREKKTRYMSEFGYQSFPYPETVRAFAPDEKDHWINSEVMQWHQRAGKSKMGKPNDRIVLFLDKYYPTPRSFEDTLLLSQVLQADIIREAVEAHRRDMGYCWGSLYWQINDCWPVSSWSGIDWYGNWKALHYHMKRAFSEVLVSPVFSKDTLRVSVVSDRRKAMRGTLEVQVCDFTGKALSTVRRRVTVPANGAVQPFVKAFGAALDTTACFAKAVFTPSGGTAVTGHAFPATMKGLRLPAPDGLRVQVEPVSVKAAPGAWWTTAPGNAYLVRVTSPVLVRQAYLHVQGQPLHRFSDNWADLLPGVAWTSLVRSELSAAQLKDALEVWSVNALGAR